MEADLDQFAKDLPDLIEIIDENDNNIMNTSDSSSKNSSGLGANRSKNNSAVAESKTTTAAEDDGGGKVLTVVEFEPKTIRLVPLQLCAARIESLIKVTLTMVPIFVRKKNHGILFYSRTSMVS